MSPYRKNILVGATVIGGIVILGWMFLKFSSGLVGAFKPSQLAVQFESTRADGLSEGSAVLFLGVPAGRVASVRRKSDGSGVLIDALIDQEPPLPSNIRAIISSSNALGGTASLNLDIDGETAKGKLAPTTRPIIATYRGLQLNFLSPEITASVQKVGNMAEEMRVTAKQLNDSNAIIDLDTTIKQVRKTVDEATQTLAALNQTVGDPKTIDDFRKAMAGIRQTAESASSVGAKMEILAEKLSKNSDDISVTVKGVSVHVDDLSKQLGDRFEQVSKVLSNVQDITDKLNKGDGTAGQLINDPRLYKELVDSSRELSATITDLHRMVEQWEQEGVSIKMK